jgi:hypothetical protein
LPRNRLLKHVFEGKTEGARRQNENVSRKTEGTGLKEEALDHILWRVRLKETMDLSQDSYVRNECMSNNKQYQNFSLLCNKI